MAVSLFDHERRLHDLEVALKALLDLLVLDTPLAQRTLDAAAQSLRARGEDGAAGLLGRAPMRSYSR